MNLVIDEELSVHFVVRNVQKNADQIVTLNLVLMFPYSANNIGFRRDRAELFAQFNNDLPQELVRHSRAVIKPQRQKDFVPTE